MGFCSIWLTHVIQRKSDYNVADMSDPVATLISTNKSENYSSHYIVHQEHNKVMGQ